MRFEYGLYRHQPLASPRYQAAMRDYVRQGQASASGARFSLTPPTRAHIWLRNQMIRILPHMPWKGVVSAGVEKATNAIILQEYAAPSLIHV